MTDTVQTMLIDVRASTQGFASDIAAMRSTVDGTLIDGFAQAGNVLERGLLSAIRKGSLGFEDFGRIALKVLDQIAAQAVQSLFSGSGGAGQAGGVLNFAGLIGSIFGLPGRAMGGPVSPGRGYLVGERGPEVFVPTSSGRIDASPMASASRDVRITININAPSAPAATQALQRSSRQVASAVRRALRDF